MTAGMASSVLLGDLASSYRALIQPGQCVKFSQNRNGWAAAAVGCNKGGGNICNFLHHIKFMFAQIILQRLTTAGLQIAHLG